MADINKVILVGRLTKDSTLKYTQSGYPVADFSIAVNRNVKRGEGWENEVSFFDVILWDKQAENLNQYLLKGKMIALEGFLKQERWEQDGINRSRVIITAQSIQLLGGNNQNEGSYQNNQNYGRQTPPLQNGYGSRPVQNAESAYVPQNQRGRQNNIENNPYNQPPINNGLDNIPF
ncbi:single-stranded DNA-binding protein [Treponema putidum]|uniref:single-stranded DNA-binding protein n=1 Tax=Treponema putidum TaxID=221027 RepID=UPI003D94C7C1